jgi:DDE family transposase
LNSTNEPLSVHRHLCLCGSKRSEDSSEVHTLWVKNKISPFQLLFNASLKVDFQGSRVTSDGGLILVRELDERLGLEKLIEEHLSDSRQGLNKQFTLVDLLRQSV